MRSPLAQVIAALKTGQSLSGEASGNSLVILLHRAAHFDGGSDIHCGSPANLQL